MCTEHTCLRQILTQLQYFLWFSFVVLQPELLHDRVEDA